MPNGACACSRIKSSNCTSLNAPATTPSGGLLKKHSQAASEATMGHCARRQRGLCGQHGGRAGGLSETARSRAPRRVPRRDLEADDRRNAPTDSRQARTQGASRLRIRAQWRGQFVHDVRASGRLAACESDRPSHRHRLCPRAQGFVRHAFFRRGEDRAGADNLSTHKPASLYEAFPASEARRLAERFEWHYTPKHGSWLDMAESELGVLSAQCLDRRIPDKQTLTTEVAAWERNRNTHHAKADWQFTTADARVKLKRLYPQFE